MAREDMQRPTNERIMQLLEELKAELAESKAREQQIASDLTRLFGRG